MPSQQRPLYPSRPTIVLGLGVLLLASFGAFDSPEGRERGFAFGADVKPVIVRLSSDRCALSEWGIAIVPKGDYRFFRIETFDGIPSGELAFCSIDSEVIGRARPLDPLRDDWSVDGDSDGAIEELEEVTWQTPQRDRGFASTVHVGRFLRGTTPLILTVHQFGAGSRREADYSSMLEELVRCFEPL
ncbi:MAG: hypothetical protein AAFU85_19465 [Planctomycetota bacterium]